jgi:hypothetical protein
MILLTLNLLLSFSNNILLGSYLEWLAGKIVFATNAYYCDKIPLPLLIYAK